MNVLEITIQRQTRDGWPVVAELIEPGQLPRRSESTLSLAADWETSLRQKELAPRAYGEVLGRALFRERVRDLFVQARTSTEENLRVLLVIEDQELRPLHWEWLCAPVRLGGRWDLLAPDQQVLFSRYLPSLTDRRFPPIGRRDLRALVLVADPPDDNPYGLAPFNAPATVVSIEAALAEIPHSVLANVEGALGPPTLDELAERITGQYYTLLHIVAHGEFRRSDGETIVYLLDDEGEVKPVSATRFLERLDYLQGIRGLPHLTFLATCESARPDAEGTDALGGLAQRLVRELGMPAVLAMTQVVSVATAEALASRFYVRLWAHGEPDLALAEACAGLADREDITVPALFSRLGGRPLFSDTEDRDLTATEVEFGLDEMERLLPERAPALQEEFAGQAERLRHLVSIPREQVSQAARAEWDQAMLDVNALGEEVLDLNFRALALGREPPAYDPRCPFPGLLPFQPDDRAFFFGREGLVEQLADRLAEHNFLAVLGPSGSGKSSLVLAGLVPALQQAEPDLQRAYLTPGGDPPAQLDAGLAEVDGQPAILVVDQFEELFTLCADESERRAFLDRLLPCVQEMRVVLTMRADFWGDCAPYRDLVDVMQARQELIAPMDAAEMRGAMEQQAAAVGLRFEADLANTILDDVRGEPGAMPLLQHALRELWLQRHGRWLKAGEYQAIGGVRKAIARTAEGVLRDLSPAEQDQVRDVFVRLTRLDEDIAPGEDWRDTRRRVALEELVPAGTDPAGTRALVNRLADARLVVTRGDPVTGRTEVELAHEALIRSWETLRDWLDEDRVILRRREGIRRAALEWEQNRRDASYLVHRGGRLDKAQVLLGHPRVALNELERSYVDACQALRVEDVLLGLRAALADRASPDPWLDQLRDRGQALIQQLEESAYPVPPDEGSAQDPATSLLGLYDVSPPEQPGEGALFGPVTWSAVSHSDLTTRQAAALALTVPYGREALDRLAGALETWTRLRRPGRSRKAEVWGGLAEIEPGVEKWIAELPLRDRVSVWLWRRFVYERRRLLGLTLGGAAGGGLGLALLRLVAALAAGLTPIFQFMSGYWWGLVLGAGLTLGLLVPATWTRERGAEDRPVFRRIRLSPEWQAAVTGTLGFVLAHLVVAGSTGFRSPGALGLASLAALLMGLGLSLGFYRWPWPGGETRTRQWLLRLLPVIAGALLGQIVVSRADPNLSTAVGYSGTLYRSELAGLGWQWWQDLIARFPNWYVFLGLLDAVLVAVALFLGIAFGVRFVGQWFQRQR